MISLPDRASWGIEALSRGAAECVFIDRNAAAADIVRRNLKAAGLFSSAHVLTTDSMAFLERSRDHYDLAFLDPPYASGLLPQALVLLAPLMDPGGTVVCESDGIWPRMRWADSGSRKFTAMAGYTSGFTGKKTGRIARKAATRHEKRDLSGQL